MEIKFTREPGCEDLPLPRYHSEGAAGIDLPAAVKQEIIIQPGEFKHVSTGIRMAIPPGFEGQVRPRSGLARRHGIGILNSPGTIDSDYRGVIGIILFNFSSQPFNITRGNRIAQLVISPVHRASLVKVEQIDNTQRGENGFGHTGLQ